MEQIAPYYRVLLDCGDVLHREFPPIGRALACCRHGMQNGSESQRVTAPTTPRLPGSIPEGYKRVQGYGWVCMTCGGYPDAFHPEECDCPPPGKLA